MYVYLMLDLSRCQKLALLFPRPPPCTSWFIFRILDPVELGYPDLATLLAAATDLFVLRCGHYNYFLVLYPPTHFSISCFLLL